MKEKIIFYVFTAGFFIIYFKLISFIWNRWIPYNTITDVLSIFLVFIVGIPLSVITTNIIFKNIKNN